MAKKTITIWIGNEYELKKGDTPESVAENMREGGIQFYLPEKIMITTPDDSFTQESGHERILLKENY